MRVRLLLVVLAGLVSTALAGPVAAETTRSSTLGCGMDDCVDIWRFKCPAAKTTYVFAEVCPAAPGAQSFWNVAIVGKTPAGLLGKGDVRAAAYEACTGLVYLTRPTPGTVSGYIAVSLWNQIIGGSGAYELTVMCLDQIGALVRDPTVQLRTAEDD